MSNFYLTSTGYRIIVGLYLFVFTLLLMITIGSLYDIQPDRIEDIGTRVRVTNAFRAAQGIGVMLGIGVAVFIAKKIHF
jgi:hypothetical protein